MTSPVRRTSDLATDIGSVVDAIGSRPVVLTDTALVAAGIAETVRGALRCPVLEVATGEPETGEVGRSAAALAESGADVVVAVGGGSVLDTAKLAARLVADPSGLERRLGGAAPFPAGLAVVAVPTTAGSGAERTRTAVVRHGTRKSWAWDDALRPEAVVLAPELTAGLPVRTTAASGLDAFVHALEASTARRASVDDAVVGAEVAAAVATSLPLVVSSPGDLEARGMMLEAASEAGALIDRCGTGVGHAIGHALGSLMAVPHGFAVALGHRAALEWVMETAGERYGVVSSALSAAGRGGVAGAFDGLLDAVGFHDLFPALPPPDVEALTEELTADAHRPMLRNTPRAVSEPDLALLARATVERWPV